MKKKLESELISIAHRILKLTGKEDIDKMHKEVALLYEKLTVLKFAQEHFEEDIPTIKNDSSFFSMLNTAFNNKVSDNIEIESKTYINVDERVDDNIVEPVINKIKDMVAFMPEDETQTVIQETEHIKSKEVVDFETLTKDFGNLPEFEPLTEANKQPMPNAPKSLNDKLKSGGLQIDLNDKIAFIKHLFDGKSEDYDRVISQINTATSLEEAEDFIKQLVKPDYNYWLDKEVYETRFLEIIQGKFN